MTVYFTVKFMEFPEMELDDVVSISCVPPNASRFGRDGYIVEYLGGRTEFLSSRLHVLNRIEA